jgi:hypothetical protein
MQKPKTGGGGTYFAPFKGRTWIARPDQARVKLRNVGEASRKVMTCLQKDILKNPTSERATLAVSTLARTGLPRVHPRRPAGALERLGTSPGSYWNAKGVPGVAPESPHWRQHRHGDRLLPHLLWNDSPTRSAGFTWRPQGGPRYRQSPPALCKTPHRK